jgi:hypothetical protein
MFLLLTTSADLGVLPRLLDHYLTPGQCYLLSDPAGQEHQFHSPHRGYPNPIRFTRSIGGCSGEGGSVIMGQAKRGSVPDRASLSTHGSNSCSFGSLPVVKGEPPVCRARYQ